MQVFGMVNSGANMWSKYGAADLTVSFYLTWYQVTQSFIQTRFSQLFLINTTKVMWLILKSRLNSLVIMRLEFSLVVETCGNRNLRSIHNLKQYLKISNCNYF